MQNQNEHLTLPNPRLVSAIFFGVLSIIFTFILHVIIHYGMGFEQMIPLYEGILCAVFIAAFFGALFGKRIFQTTSPIFLRAFLWAYLMILVALPFYDIGFVYFFMQTHPELFLQTTIAQIFNFYLFVLFYSIVLIGIWLGLLAGLSAIYLRGPLARYILQSINRRTRQ